MAKTLKSYRLDEVTVAAVAAYAKARGSTETAVMEAAAQSFLALAEGGVPDLPKPAAKPAPKSRAGMWKQPPKPAVESRASVMGARQKRLAREMGWDR